jgi:isoleucyl-tRNA synthetase
MDYKKTLNLPKTGFPMKANLAGREPNQLDTWETMGLYGQIREVQGAARLYAA